MAAMKTKGIAASQNAEKTAPVAVIQRGNVKISIFSASQIVGGKTYPQFRFTYYSGAQRIRKRFASLEAAKGEAELVATKLANGENEVLKLTSTDRAIYVQACDTIRPLNLPLNVATLEYVNAVKRLPQGVSLHEVVDFFLKRNPASLAQKTVREVVDELVESKRKAGRGDVHLKDLDSRLGRFAETMQMNIGQVTGSMIEMHLANLKVGGRTKTNHLRHITSLFRFAIRRKYLPKDALDELEAIEKPEAELTEIEIFSPSELAEIMSGARAELIPWLGISAFAGLRSAELQRLDWSDVNLAERYIEVTAAKSKTASRRLVPIADNLLEWLRPYVQKNGPVTRFENMARQIVWLVEDVNQARCKAAQNAGQSVTEIQKFEWKRNGLRHSFVSYRLALIKDVAEVALEAGNSPTMIFRHYRQLVTESEASKWFAIKPCEQNNILPIKAVA